MWVVVVFDGGRRPFPFSCISSFRLLPPRHEVPLWTRFLVPVLVAGVFLGVTFWCGPAFRFPPLPRFWRRLFLLRLRFFMGVLERLRDFVINGRWQPPITAGSDVVVSLAPFPGLAVPLDSLLPEEVELLWVG